MRATAQPKTSPGLRPVRWPPCRTAETRPPQPRHGLDQGPDPLWLLAQKSHILVQRLAPTPHPAELGQRNCHDHDAPRRADRGSQHLPLGLRLHDRDYCRRTNHDRLGSPSSPQSSSCQTADKVPWAAPDPPRLPFRFRNRSPASPRGAAAAAQLAALRQTRAVASSRIPIAPDSAVPPRPQRSHALAQPLHARVPPSRARDVHDHADCGFHSSHTPAVRCRATPCVPSPPPSASSAEHHCYDVPVTSPSAAAAPVPYPAPFLELACSRAWLAWASCSARIMHEHMRARPTLVRDQSSSREQGQR